MGNREIFELADDRRFDRTLNAGNQQKEEEKMSRQSADKEMKTIRRVIDAMNGLTPGQQKRVMQYVAERIGEEPAQAKLPLAAGATNEVRLGNA